MTNSADSEKKAMSTPLKLLLVLSLALAPIAGLLTWSAVQEVSQHNDALQAKADAARLNAVRAVDGLIARNALALRVASSGAFAANAADPCAAAQRSLEVTPALSQQFIITDGEGTLVCGDEDIIPARAALPMDAGEIDVWIARDLSGVMLRVGVANGSAATLIGSAELRDTIEATSPSIAQMTLQAEGRTLPIISEVTPNAITHAYGLAGDRITAQLATPKVAITTADRMLIFLPVFLLLAAILLSWLLVHRLLLRPLRRLTRAIGEHDPDEHGFEMPARLGPATEIRALGDAFSGAVGRLESSEQETATALEGQRKLVREVHHRVKNNLQVVASLLSIHSRGASGEEAKAAYAGIGRRVEALAVVHRNHFAEVEESRGIQLRPLITELASSLRASTPDGSNASPIDLDLISASTTQDTAVAAAFLITEVVEYIIDHGSAEPIEIRLDRTSEITARLTIASEALVENNKDVDRVQFDRIVEGLARQLRSPLEKRLGRYSVELPIFAEE